MDELIIDYNTIKSKLEDYSNNYLTDLEDTMVSVSSGSLGTCGDAKIVSLTSQLKNKFYGIKDSSNTLNSVLNEYLDEFAKAEGELANQKAGVCECAQ